MTNPTSTFTISGNRVDLLRQEIAPATLTIADGRIVEVRRDAAEHAHFLIPGLVDAHLHLESSMLTPGEFARAAVVHGTVAAVCDPHEIANVCGLDGVRYLVAAARQSALKFRFGAPSCVPATAFETSGAALGSVDIEALFRDGSVSFLAEVMNVPGVLSDDAELVAKLAVARRYSAPIDGHAPGLLGPDLRHYLRAGISTDHEAISAAEALAKVEAGMKILIREGSAARNLDALLPVLAQHPAACMLCSDDKHPDDLLRGHINLLARRAVAAGVPILKVLRAASLNPVMHYDLDVGLLQHGDPADFLVVDNLRDLNVLATYIGGRLVAETGQTRLERADAATINCFAATPRSPADFAVPAGGVRCRVIGVQDGQLVTEHLVLDTPVTNGLAVPDVGRDVLKIAVVNRYRNEPPAVGFVRGFGLRAGALASSVAHDSHNIVAIGTDDAALCRAVNLVIEARGGIAVTGPDVEELLSLPVAGLISTGEAGAVGAAYTRLDSAAKALGCGLRAPFMTLSFMALLVIPKLKLGDRGLFDGARFAFTSLWAE